jgi:hypothetical protein
MPYLESLSLGPQLQVSFGGVFRRREILFSLFNTRVDALGWHPRRRSLRDTPVRIDAVAG